MGSPTGRGNTLAKPAETPVLTKELTGGESRRCHLGEVGDTRFEIEPELRPIDDVHERLAARANPLVKAPSQSAAVAGLAGPLFSASFTHC